MKAIKSTLDLLAKFWWFMVYGKEMMTILTLAFVIVNSSGTIQAFIQNNIGLVVTKFMIVTILVPTGVSLVIFTGYFLARVLNFKRRTEREMIKDGHAWREVFNRLDKIEEAIKRNEK